jgi:hypothetical protein
MMMIKKSFGQKAAKMIPILYYIPIYIPINPFPVIFAIFSAKLNLL